MDAAISTSKEVTLTDIERLEGAMLPYNEPVEVKHTFAPGVYVREAHFPAGMLAIGHEHKTEHVNMILKGRFSVLENGAVRQVVAPCTFVSKPGVRKVAFFHEETLWANIHPNPTDEVEQEKLESIFIVKSETWKKFHLTSSEMKSLTAPVSGLTN